MQLYVNQEIEIWVCTSNGTDQLSLVRPEYSGPALKVVHIDQSGHFSRLDHLTKLLSPVLLFCILLTRTMTNAWWLRSGLCNRNVLFHWACEISKTSNWNFCWMESTLSFFIETIPLHPGGHRFRTLGSLQIFWQYSFTCSLPALIIWGILVTCCFNIATHHRSTFISIPIMPPATMDHCNTWKN